MNGMAPGYLSEKFVHRGSISGRCTKNSQSFNIPLYKSATGQITFYYCAVSLWNDLKQVNSFESSHFANTLCSNIKNYFESLSNNIQ